MRYVATAATGCDKVAAAELGRSAAASGGVDSRQGRLFFDGPAAAADGDGAGALAGLRGLQNVEHLFAARPSRLAPR
jgi:hypothetical protein